MINMNTLLPFDSCYKSALIMTWKLNRGSILHPMSIHWSWRKPHRSDLKLEFEKIKPSTCLVPETDVIESIQDNIDQSLPQDIDRDISQDSDEQSGSQDLQCHVSQDTQPTKHRCMKAVIIPRMQSILAREKCPAQSIEFDLTEEDWKKVDMMKNEEVKTMILGLQEPFMASRLKGFE
ncbi:hypothetical protein C8J56DRAFT_901742 [Mycena floridula]|nr:hypothetical protein C8J56DRAFT_901742 [Mycena floridula]